MKRITLLFGLIIFMFGCDTINPIGESVVESVAEKNSVRTMEITTVFVYNAELEENYTALFDDEEVTLSRTSDTSLVYMIPLNHPGGSAQLHFSVADEEQLIDYQVTVSGNNVPDPEAYIENLSANYLTVLDTMQFSNSQARENAALAKSFLQEGFDLFETLSSEQKRHVAEILNMNIPLLEESDTYKKTLQDVVVNYDPQFLLKAAGKVIIYSTAISADIAMTVGCIYIPEPVVSKVAALIGTGMLIHDIVEFMELLEEIYSKKGIFVEFTDGEVQKKSISSLEGLEFVKEQEKSVMISADFRAMESGDVNSSSDIIRHAANVIESVSSYYRKAKEVVKKVNDFFDMVKGAITGEDPETLSNIEEREELAVYGKHLKVTNIEPASVYLVEAVYNEEDIVLTFGTELEEDIEFEFTLEYDDGIFQYDTTIKATLLVFPPCDEEGLTIDGVEYPTKCFGGIEWMTLNLKALAPGSICYDSPCYYVNDGCDTKYGRHYTWAQAQTIADRVEGWRLPTYEEASAFLDLFGDDMYTRFDRVMLSEFAPPMGCREFRTAHSTEYFEQSFFILDTPNQALAFTDNMGAYINVWNEDSEGFVRLVRDK